MPTYNEPHNLSDFVKLVSEMQLEIDRLEDRVNTLECALTAITAETDKSVAIQRILKLTKAQSQLLAYLTTGMKTREQLLTFLEFAGHTSCDLNSYIYHIRRRLQQHGIAVGTAYGSGYYLADADRTALELILTEGVAVCDATA